MENEDLASDLLDGVPAIAKFTGWSQRRVYYLAEQGLIPLAKVGDRWTGRKSTLRRHLSDLESGTAA
jgi:hypothetical protein